MNYFQILSIKLNNSVVDYFQIVKWPSPNIGKVLHLDHAHSHTSLSSIIYLNDEFDLPLSLSSITIILFLHLSLSA